MIYEYIASPNKSSRKGNQVSGIIAHFTAGGSLNSTVRYMCNKIINEATGEPYNAQASSHYITGRDGTTISLVKESMAAWHAGSRTTKPKLKGKGSLNLWTIGHEICNWGGLLKRGDEFFCWPNNWTKRYEGPTPSYVLRKCDPAVHDKFYRAGGQNDGKLLFPKGIIEYWEPYTEEQIKAVITLWKELVERYEIGHEWIAGHEKVDPTRKIDPGPAFPWVEILDAVYPAPRLMDDDLVPELLRPIDSEGIYELSLQAKESRKEIGICSRIISSILK